MHRTNFEYLKEVLKSFLAVLIGFIVGAVILMVMGYNPVKTYGALLSSAFSKPFRLLSSMTPILLTGVSAALMFNASLFFIGMEGQLYIGAILAFVAGYIIILPPGIHHLIAIVAGGLGGLLWSLTPGFLKVMLNVNETVLAIMLNWIATYLLDYVVQYVFIDPMATITRTYNIASSASLPNISIGVQLNWSFVIAILVVFVTGALLFNTSIGYEIRVIGGNQRAARFYGINVEKTILKVFMISGFLSGLSGGLMVVGEMKSIIYRFSPGYGWDGITAALMARGNPYAVIPASLLLAILRSGSIGMMVYAGISSEIVQAIQGAILIAASAPGIYDILLKKIS